VGSYSTKDALLFESGDFVIDVSCNEIGRLLMRINLIEDSDYPIYAWDILWSGDRSSRIDAPRRAPYTEESLKNMIIEGLLLYYKNN
tara:strand:+ start:117 stop:377 length:261 start_codon:yes stop_codon:yes gene_type:complete